MTHHVRRRVTGSRCSSGRRPNRIMGLPTSLAGHSARSGPATVPPVLRGLLRHHGTLGCRRGRFDRPASAAKDRSRPRGTHGPPAPALEHTTNSGSEDRGGAGIEGLRGVGQGSQVSNGSLLCNPARTKTPGPAFRKAVLNRCCCSTGCSGVGLGERGEPCVSRGQCEVLTHKRTSATQAVSSRWANSRPRHVRQSTCSGPARLSAAARPNSFVKSPHVTN
jgi:hypothetical protein